MTSNPSSASVSTRSSRSFGSSRTPLSGCSDRTRNARLARNRVSGGLLAMLDLVDAVIVLNRDNRERRNRG